MFDHVHLGSWVVVFLVEQGGCYAVAAQHFDEIDAAYGDWTERRRDRVLALTATNGSDLRIAVSRISEFGTSTPDTRACGRALMAAEKSEAGFAD